MLKNKLYLVNLSDFSLKRVAVADVKNVEWDNEAIVLAPKNRKAIALAKAFKARKIIYHDCLYKLEPVVALIGDVA